MNTLSDIQTINNLNVEINKLIDKRDSLMQSIMKECKHPRFALSIDIETHTSGDEYSNNLTYHEEHYTTCDICGHS
jgi:hypothetical protein